MTEYFWRPKDLAKILDCSMSKAYKMMQKWNKELKERGYETVAGRVPKQYAIDRLGLEARGIEKKESDRGIADAAGRSAGILRGRNHGRLPVRFGASR